MAKTEQPGQRPKSAMKPERLTLDTLTLRGFKSFADRVEVEFKEGLTGIVGPNGCGKSNIIDGLRWVMGESSASQLRSTQQEDVIFAGSGQRSQAMRAEVSIGLSGVPRDSLAGQREDQVDIVRQIIRGSGSRYRSAGQEVRARDVRILFNDGASGARSTAIIGQGQTQLMIEARDQDRRKLLEEAAGVTGFHERRREAEERLRAAEANLERIADTLIDQEKRQETLKRQARAAERYSVLGAKIRHAQYVLCERERLDGQEQLKTLEHAYRLDEERRQADRLQLQEHRQQLEEARQALESARQANAVLATKREASDAQQVSMQSVFDEADARRLASEIRLKEADAELAAQSLKIESVTSEISQSAVHIEATEQAVSAMAGQHEQSMKELPELEEAMAALRAEQETARQLFDRATATALDAKRSVEQQQQEFDRNSRDRAAQQARMDALEHRKAALVMPDLDGLEQKLSASLAEIEAAEQYLNEAEAASRASLQAIEASQRQVEVLQSRKQAEDTRIEQHRALEASRRAQADALAGQHALIEEALGQNQAKQQADQSAEDAHLQVVSRLKAEQQAEDAHLVEIDAALAKLTATSEELTAQLGQSETKRQTAQQALTDLEQRLEILNSLIGQDTDDEAVMALVASTEPGYRAALLAALGESATALGASGAAGAHWRAMSRQDGSAPSWPTSLSSLGDVVDAPDVLQRMLGMTALCTREHAERLQAQLTPGQALVTEDGGFWRWDGYVRPAEARPPHLLVPEYRAERTELLQLVETKRASLMQAESEWQALSDQSREEEARIETQKAARLEAEKKRTTLDQQLEGAEQNARERALRRESLQQEYQQLLDQQTHLRALKSDHTSQDLVTQADLDLLSSLEADIRSVRDQTQTQREQAQNMQATLERARQRRDTAKADATRHQAKRDGAHAQKLQSDVEDRLIREQMEEGRAQLCRVEEEVSAGAVSLKAAKSAFERAASQEAEADAALKTITSAFEEKHKLRETWLAENQQRAASRDQMQEDIARTRQKRDALTQRLADLKESLEEIRKRQTQMKQDAAVNEDQATRLKQQIEAFQLESSSLLEAISTSETHEKSCLAAFGTCEEKVSGAEQNLTVLDQRQAERSVAIGVARSDLRRAEAAFAQAKAALGDDEVNAEQADLFVDKNIQSIREEIERLERSRDRLMPVNLLAQQELEILMAELGDALEQRQDLESAVTQLRKAVSDINEEARIRLRKAHDVLQEHFRAMFQKIFGGGRADLVLTGMEDPLQAGLSLHVAPPGKKLQHCTLLSGGEKALTAIALAAALFLTRPGPICVLDEVDAPLDDSNVERFVDLVRELKDRTQTKIVVVTHHPLTMSAMDRLFGVTMSERGVSMIVSVDFDEAAELTATA